MDQEDVMMENGKRRTRRQLSPEEKWEIFGAPGIDVVR